MLVLNLLKLDDQVRVSLLRALVSLSFKGESSVLAHARVNLYGALFVNFANGVAIVLHLIDNVTESFS